MLTPTGSAVDRIPSGSILSFVPKPASSASRRASATSASVSSSAARIVRKSASWSSALHTCPTRSADTSPIHFRTAIDPFNSLCVTSLMTPSLVGNPCTTNPADMRQQREQHADYAHLNPPSPRDARRRRHYTRQTTTSPAPPPPPHPPHPSPPHPP